ncbi:MAG: DUF6314 family protein, partial [Jannaschia sp.]
ATGPREDALWREVETGHLSQGGPVFAARRVALWSHDGLATEVRFGDGRLFHGIGPGLRPQATHDCPPDDYRLSYDFSAWPRWSVRWHVTGPRKAYRALTRYVSLVDRPITR